MKRWIGLAWLALVAFGCGGDNGNPTGPGNGGNNGGNSMSATIDGQAWSNDAGGVSVSGAPNDQGVGLMIITGIKVSPVSSVSITLGYVLGPGTYPLGVNHLTTQGGFGTYSRDSNGWVTPLSGQAGSVTITTRTATRIAGTFNFTADPTGGSGGASVVVTNGSFDVTKAAGLPALPIKLGSSMSATLGGAQWIGATVTGVAQGHAISALSTDFSVSLLPIATVAAGHTYSIGPEVSMTINRVETSDFWVSSNGPGVGTFNLESLTNDRMEGTFSATLPPSGSATTPLTITNGHFSVRLN